MPLVSVIIPTYNRPVFLRRAVRSVLKQTFSDLEIIVINDGGDDPRILVPELENKKVKFINLDTNRERSVARNIGIDRSSGKYIAYLDDDDMFYPNHISILTRTLNENRSFKIVYSDAYRAYQVITSHGVKTILKDVPYSVDFSDADLFVQNYIPILCVMHDIEVVEKVGKFDESLSVHEDWDLWIRMAMYYKFIHLKKITCEFSWRTDGSSTTSKKPHEFVRTRRLIWNRYRTNILRKLEEMVKTRDRRAINYASTLLHIFPEDAVLIRYIASSI